MNKEEKINHSIKHCEICDNLKCGEFIIINKKKYHLSCIEQLQYQLEISEQKINKAIDWIEDIQVIIIEQPSDNLESDNWFIAKLNSIKDILECEDDR